ncbi:MAG TPA: hypothetical protein VKR05_01925, partial [Candidatus Cybelea sp.]|nr:hypothetical protein [Candidatus Cybelea sp.]
GGWPTTAFLAPDGSTLTGATYLTPPQMQRALDDIAEFYRTNKEQVAQRSAQLRDRKVAHKPSAPDDLRESMIVRLVEELIESFDEEYAGFGDSPKFPQPEVHEFLLSEWRATGQQRLYDMVARTMLAMAGGGMYDRVEGGFFRYSTTRDWSVPHFEKMAEDHAGLLRLLAQLVQVAPHDFRTTLVSATNYVRTVLRDPRTGLFAGSQDADEEYYELPLEERRKLTTPYVDRTSYTNWTCALAGALAIAGRALDDDALVNEALAALDYTHDRLLDADGLVYHFVADDAAPQVRGLLTDQVAYLRAMLDAHEIAGQARFLERAQALCDRIVSRFEAQDGGFYDRIAIESTIGRLDFADRPIVDNGLLAESLLRLAALTGIETYAETAARTLLLFARTYAAASPFAATYARALRRYLSPDVSVRIVGPAGETDEFREAAWRLPGVSASIRTVAPDAAASLGLPAAPSPAAYVCAGTVCGAPATEPAALRAAYDAVILSH